jgi:hypothetical protein
VKLWKIVQSDGTTIDSYQAATKVVIGQGTGVASNVVVNTVNGSTGTAANVVVGESGNGGVTVVGGKQVVNTVQTQTQAQTQTQSSGSATGSNETTNSVIESNNTSTQTQTQTGGNGQ